jgi:aryl-alcohol dehydrogenase-like predicted oxidoreductase
MAARWFRSRSPDDPGAVVVAPIIGATKIEHLDAAVRALELTLTPEEIAQLEAPVTCS